MRRASAFRGSSLAPARAQHHHAVDACLPLKNRAQRHIRPSALKNAISAQALIPAAVCAAKSPGRRPALGVRPVKSLCSLCSRCCGGQASRFLRLRQGLGAEDLDRETVVAYPHFLGNSNVGAGTEPACARVAEHQPASPAVVLPSEEPELSLAPATRDHVGIRHPGR